MARSWADASQRPRSAQRAALGAHGALRTACGHLRARRAPAQRPAPSGQGAVRGTWLHVMLARSQRFGFKMNNSRRAPLNSVLVCGTLHCPALHRLPSLMYAVHPVRSAQRGTDGPEHRATITIKPAAFFGRSRRPPAACLTSQSRAACRASGLDVCHHSL